MDSADHGQCKGRSCCKVIYVIVKSNQTTESQIKAFSQFSVLTLTLFKLQNAIVESEISKKKSGSGSIISAEQFS